MILILISGVILLLLLIGWMKLNAFLALVLTALYVGIVNGMPLQQVVSSMTAGIGSTLGPLILVLGLGVIFGSLLTETGAAGQISRGLVRLFGIRLIKPAMVLTGFCVGIALFYNAGFIVLIPLVFSVAANTGLPLLYVAIAMASSLSVTHGFLPPHPGPTAIVTILHANIGKTLLYGFLVSIPILFVAGIIFPEFIRKIPTSPQKDLFATDINVIKPPFFLSLLIALLPVILMGAATFCELMIPNNDGFSLFIRFLGDPSVALLIAVLAALGLGLSNKCSMRTLMGKSNTSINAIASIILIIAAGGGFKQVLTDSGIAGAIAGSFSHTSLSPLLLGWIVAMLIRVSIGSSTIAGLMSAGIVQPLLVNHSVNPELMVLSIGAGSLMFSHVNDTGFWMFKEYLGLSLTDTFRSWTIMESLIGIMGLVGVLLLSLFVH